jgi:primase-polymerase (primpol)-like protein
VILQPIAENISALMCAEPHWVVWKIEIRVNQNGEVKTTKVPYNARTCEKARSNNPRTWSTFQQAWAAYQNGGYDGIGFCLAEPWAGADLDGVVSEGGTIEGWAQEVIAQLNSYTELSPSATGVRIIVLGALLPGRRQVDFPGREHYGIALFDHTSPRYLTITGHRLSLDGYIGERTRELAEIHRKYFPQEESKTQTKTQSEQEAKAEEPILEPFQPTAELIRELAPEDVKLIEDAKSAGNGDRFTKLWNGEIQAYDNDESRVDLALCRMLAFWCGADIQRIERLFSHCALADEKWFSRPDYRNRTIQRAVDAQEHFHTPASDIDTGASKNLNTAVKEVPQTMPEAKAAGKKSH